MILAMQSPALRVATSELGECERLFLWCMRSWVHAAFHGTASGDFIRLALKQHGLVSSGDDIEAMMGSLARFAGGTIDVRIRRATELSSDEIRLVRALHAMFAERDGLAADLLRPLVHQPGLGEVLDRLRALGAAFRSAGLGPCAWPAPDRRRREPVETIRRRGRRAPGNDVA